jgi:hypothetical protein
MTAVCGPTMGRICAMACSVSQSFTPSITTSIDADVGRPVRGLHLRARAAAPALRCASRCALRIASRCLPRATKCTSACRPREPRPEVAAQPARTHDPDAHGGTFNGFFLIRGTADQLNALANSPEWVQHQIRATMHLDGTAICRAVAGAAVAERMGMWMQAIPK